MNKKILVIILSYDAQEHIEKVLARLPEELFSAPDYSCDVLMLDDASRDETATRARRYLETHTLPMTVQVNGVNQGYGGNQKIGYNYAIDHGYDIAVMLHGDGQYPPERIAELVRPLLDGQADAVLGSRMLTRGGALRGGMPLYKFIGNHILTAIQNFLLGSRLSEFHTGFRAYSLAALKTVPFAENSNDFDFDTDILIQLLFSGKRITEIAIPTHYGDEVCHVNGVRYALQVLRSSWLAKCQRRGIFYHPKFDLHRPGESPSPYRDKTHFASSHSWAVEQVPANSRVLDIGCGSGAYVARALLEKGCLVRTMDGLPDTQHMPALHYRQVDLDAPHIVLSEEEKQVSVVLMLDIIEHLNAPEEFLRQLRMQFQQSLPVIYITTPNVAFIIIRLMLLLGWFNYGKRGILDMTHKRLFTFSSIKKTLEFSGYKVEYACGIPAPLPLAVDHKALARWLLKINQLLIRVHKRLFSYQIAVVAQPLPTLDTLIAQSQAHPNAGN